MNRTLIAVAVLAGFGVARSAQADEGHVTLYGKLTLGVESVQATGATLPNQNIERRMRVTDGFSYLGFRGSEEISDDLSVFWQIESQIKPDDSCGFAGCSSEGRRTALGLSDDRYGRTTSPNTGTSRIANRPSFVGLKGNWGQISLGRLDMYYDKHVPNELHLLRSGLSSTALAILGTNQLSNSVGGSDLAVAQSAFTAALLPVVTQANNNNANSGTTAIAVAIGRAVGQGYLQGQSVNQMLTAASTAAQQATAQNLSSLSVSPQAFSAALNQSLGNAAVQAFTPGSQLNRTVLDLARAYTLQYAFHNVGHRHNNVVQYRSPSFGGFSVLAAVSGNEDKGELGVNYALDSRLHNPEARRTLNPFNSELTLHYLSKGVFASLSTMIEKDPYSMGGVLDRAYGIKLAGGYQINPQLRVGGVYERQVNQYNAALGFDDNSRDTWVLSSSYRFSDLTEAVVTYGEARDAKIHGVKDPESGARYFQMTGLFSLSKRTNLFATYARVSNDANAGYNFYVSGAVQPDGSIQSAQYTPRGSDPTSLQLGINHTF